jgi:predicted oxidoreductase
MTLDEEYGPQGDDGIEEEMHEAKINEDNEAIAAIQKRCPHRWQAIIGAHVCTRCEKQITATEYEAIDDIPF